MAEFDAASATSLNTVFDVLADDYRRDLLLRLLECDPTETVDPETPVGGELDDGDDESLELLLRHAHLPKLDDEGFVAWNRETGSVGRGPRFEEVRPILELLDERGPELLDAQR